MLYIIYLKIITLTPSMFLKPTVRSYVKDLDTTDNNSLNKRVRYLQNNEKI